MRIITVEEFLEEMKKDWDCVHVVFFNYETRYLEAYWVNTESMKYDEKEKRIHFEDFMKFLPHSMPITEKILVDKKQIWNREDTEYIMNLNDNEDVTFQATKIF